MAKLKVGDYVAGWFRPIKIRAGNTKYLGSTDEELELTAYQIAKDNLELRLANAENLLEGHDLPIRGHSLAIPEQAY